MTTTANAAQPEFAIQRLYIKDISFESPMAPQIFDQSLQPMINLNIQVNSSKLADELLEVELAITVSATSEQKTVFLIEVKQAGIFTIKNIPEQNMPGLIHITCPTILFPYIRETVSELATRGGFQHFYLAPINFEALYLNSLQKQSGENPTAADHVH